MARKKKGRRRRVGQARYGMIVQEAKRFVVLWSMHNASGERLAQLVGAKTIEQRDCIDNLVNEGDYTVDQMLFDLGTAAPKKGGRVLRRRPHKSEGK